jgi:CRP-like cAMP-binding protein
MRHGPELALEQLPLLRKLRLFMPARLLDIATLGALVSRQRRADTDEVLISEGSPSRAAVLIHEGWAIRYRSFDDGRRQILEFMLPGDFCDPSSFISYQTDSTIAAISPIQYSLVNPQSLLDAVTTSPTLGLSMWWLESQRASMMRNHMTALGRMNARERIGYLIWQLTHRLDLVAERPSPSYRLPVSQEMIADATGLSVVHVSRTLAWLQQEGLIDRHNHTYTILCTDRLRELAHANAEWPQRLPAGLGETMTLAKIS